MTPSMSAISSMNYFFLKTITKKINHEIINEELDGFIKTLATDHHRVGKATTDLMLEEITEGEYFNDLSLEEIKDRLNTGIEHITGEQYPSVTTFYMFIIEPLKSNQNQKG